MAIEVFNRYEKKYMVDAQSYLKLAEGMKDYMEPDRYNQNGESYNICNIYYDTPNDCLIRNSIEKPVYKEKLRMRSYGTPKRDDTVFLEIKKKYDGIVNKRRTAMRLDAARAYMQENTMQEEVKSGLNMQVFREIDYFRKIYELVPKVYISYKRYAYFEKDDGDFRVTFDTDILTRRYDLELSKGSYGDALLPHGQLLMEIKTGKAVPLWFTRLISQYNIRPCSFSKYGTEYKKYVAKTFYQNLSYKGETRCLNQFLPQQAMVQLV